MLLRAPKAVLKDGGQEPRMMLLVIKAGLQQGGEAWRRHDPGLGDWKMCCGAARALP